MTTLWATEAGLYVGIDNRGNIVTSVSYHRALAKFTLSRNGQKTQLSLYCLRVTYRFYSVQRQTILLIKGRPLGHKGLKNYLL